MDGTVAWCLNLPMGETGLLRGSDAPRALPCCTRKVVGTLLAMALLPVGVPAMAHHSGGLWDQTKTLTLQGTVRQFQWTNPHCFIQLLVLNDAGSTGTPAQQEWSIEMASPFQVLSGGWRPGTLQAGDKIKVTVHPARDGTRAGNFISAVSADGHALGARAHAQ